MKKIEDRRKPAPNTSAQAKEPVKPSKKKIGKNTTVYPADVGHHGTDKEQGLNAEE
jgi:hypothetical protein